MDRKRLFDENERYTDTGSFIDQQISRKMREIAKKFEKEGYSIREIIHIMTMAALAVEWELLLETAHRRVKKRREKTRNAK